MAKSENWAECFLEYLDGHSISSIAKAHRIPYDILYRRSRKENWEKQKQQHLDRIREEYEERKVSNASELLPRLAELDKRVLSAVEEMSEQLDVITMKRGGIGDAFSVRLEYPDADKVSRLVTCLKLLHDVIDPDTERSIKIEVGEEILQLGE